VNLQVPWVILGHSERRALLGESNDVSLFSFCVGRWICVDLVDFFCCIVYIFLSIFSAVLSIYSCVTAALLHAL
jgi:hypothetical protein